MGLLRNFSRFLLAFCVIATLMPSKSHAQWGWLTPPPPGPGTMMMQMQNMNQAAMASDIYNQQAWQAAAMGNPEAAMFNMWQSTMAGLEADNNRRAVDRTYYRMLQESQRPYVQEREVIYQQPPHIHYVQPNQVVQQPVQQYRYVRSGAGYVPQEMQVQYVQNVPANTLPRPAVNPSAGSISVQVPAGARYWVVPGTNPPQVQYDPATGDPNQLVTVNVPVNVN